MKLYISETAGINSATCFRTQEIDITPDGLMSEAIDAKCLRLYAEAPCTVSFGKAAIPLAAGQLEWLTAEIGQQAMVKAAGVQGMDSLSVIAQVLGDPKAAMARAQECAAAEAAANKAKAEAKAASEEAKISAASAAAKSAG